MRITHLMARRRLECCIKIIRNMLIICIFVVLFCAYKVRKLHKNEVASQIPKDSLKYIFFNKKPQSHIKSPETIASLISFYNQQENILNEDFYGPIEKDTVVFVVTVHKLSIYLEFLLVSLSQVRGIENAFIIFSHSYFDDDLNDLIQSIDFARVMQIFYPFSIQLYSNVFPGFHPLDCPYSMSIEDAEAVNCTGSFDSDLHGHYRNPTHSELKHHWWWTANTVFEKLSSSINHRGLVIFLNDDVFLLQDFMYMIISMRQVANFLPSYDFLSLDTTLDMNNLNSYRVDIQKWVPTNNPDVLAFDVNTWKSIVSYYDLFCDIDDYSWARSLYFVSLNRERGTSPYRVMTARMARAFKTSNCGFEAKLVDCDAIESVYQVLNLQKKMKDELFPIFLEVYTLVELEDSFENFDFAQINGGWKDPRDKELCQKFTIRKKKLK